MAGRGWLARGITAEGAVPKNRSNDMPLWVIVEFVSAGYVYVYRRSNRQVNYFYQNLLRHQDTALAISLCDQLDESRRDDARLRLIEILMNRAVLIAPDFEPSKPKTTPLTPVW